MNKITFLSIVFLIVLINSNFAQSALPINDAKIVNEIAPSDFKNYEGSLLVLPAFRAKGTKKWLTKQFERNYEKPFYIADASDIRTGYGDDKYPIETYKYMIFIQSSKNFSGNTEYSFQLIDRSANIIYYHLGSGNTVKQYLRKIKK